MPFAGPDYTVAPNGYTMTEDNRVLRNGVQIAIYDPLSRQLTYPNPKDARYGTSVAHALRAWGKQVVKKTDAQKNRGIKAAIAEAEKPNWAPAPEPEPEPAPVQNEAPQQPQQPEPKQPDMTETTNTSTDTEQQEIPPIPPKLPQHGDKTAAVVEWYRDYDHDEFIRRYAGRKTHLGMVESDGTVTPIPEKKRQSGGLSIGSL